MKFWIKWLHLFGGRLAISLVRNDDMARITADGPVVFHKYAESDLGWFATLRVGPFFVNVDWC